MTAVTFGAPRGLDTGALAITVGPSTTVTESVPGRYRIETSDQTAPALAAAVTAFLAERGVAMTDLVVGRTLEDVYFSAVGPEAATSEADAGADETATTRRGGRRRRRSRT
jgi:hypothetical protein